MLVPAPFAFIPSPASGAIHLGGLQLRMYGLMIALGVIAAVWLAGKRLEERGIGTRDQMASIALWAVPAGIIGARLYHVITDWELFRDDPIRMFYIWEGGLGIWGGIGLGVAVGVWRAWKLGIPLLPGLDAVTPALPLAQAIGRIGNWWNQELFGRPTTLPWGLQISLSHRPAGYEQYATFHPTFLYEALWDLLLVFALIWIDKKGWLRPGRLILVYVAGYTFARFFIEGLRIDAANKIFGLRVNEWVSAIVFFVAVGWLAIDAWRHRGEPNPRFAAVGAGPVERADVVGPPEEVVSDAETAVPPSGRRSGELDGPGAEVEVAEPAHLSGPGDAPVGGWSEESDASDQVSGPEELAAEVDDHAEDDDGEMAEVDDPSPDAARVSDGAASAGDSPAIRRRMYPD